MRRKWSKERVIEAIQVRQHEGLPLQGALMTDRALLSAATRHCGGWRKALAAAQIPVPLRQAWTKELVIERLRAWHWQGRRLAELWKVDWRLVSAAQRHFGRLSRAIVAAGVPLPSRLKWTRERILAVLPSYAREGQPLLQKQVPAALGNAIYRHFASWREAVAAAGMTPVRPPGPPQTRWTKRRVIETIQARHRQGEPLNASANGPLVHAAHRCFGSWRNGLLAAGLTVRIVRKWTAARVIEQLHLLHHNGAFQESTRTQDGGLIEAARQYFGTWRKALEHAGVLEPHETFRRPGAWTRQRVIEAIQDRYVRGLSLSSRDVRTLAAAGRRRFGGWHAALLAAGIAPEDATAQRTGKSSTTLQKRISACNGKKSSVRSSPGKNRATP